jgi:hypothetical protein
VSASLFGSAGSGIEQAAHGPEPLATVARVAAVVLCVLAVAQVGAMLWTLWRNRHHQ